MSSSLVDECYRRAREARRSAEIASMPTQKTHFLDLEQRWLRARRERGAKKHAGDKGAHGAAEDRYARC
jgi:hypothetical protein